MSVKITKALLRDIDTSSRKASRGPWIIPATGLITSPEGNRTVAMNLTETGQADLDYICTVSPDVGLALVEEIRRLRKENLLLIKQLRWLAKWGQGEQNCPYLALGWRDGRSEWCYCNDSPESGFECDEDPVECWLKAACEAVSGEYS